MFRNLKKCFSFFRLIPVIALLVILNIHYTVLLKFSSFKNLINSAKKENKFKSNMVIKNEHLVYIQNLLSKFMPFNSCLVSALSLHRICLLVNKDVKVIIGISNHNHSFHSHAWIEIEGTLFFDIPEKLYTNIYEI